MSETKTKQTIADAILEYLGKQLEQKKIQLDTHFWTEIAIKLNIALGEEQEKLAELHQEVAKLKLMWLEGQDKKNVSEAKLRTDASNEFLEWKKQDLKVGRIEEFIRIAKKMSDRAAGF